MFYSNITLDASKLTEGTKLFVSMDEMYHAAAKALNVEYDDVYGSHYSIHEGNQYSDDRGILADFNQWEEDGTPTPSPETFLNDFEL